MMTPTPPVPSPSPIHRAPKPRLGHLNMGIAKTHRIATQFVGIQLSGANLLALAVSAASVVAGTVTLAAQKYPSNWLLLLSAGVIGLGLAFLIEGLTLGSLIRIRLANRAIRHIEEKMDHELGLALSRLKVPDPNQPNSPRAMRQYRQTVRVVQQDYRRARRRATRLSRQQRRFSLPFAVMGAIASATAGGLFYHTILMGLGQIESLVLAVLFPLVVTGTFVSSEIHKDAQEDAIREGFSGGTLTETAIREETKLQSALAVHQKVVAYLEKPEAEQAIEAGAKSLLYDILTELRETSRRLAPHASVTQGSDDTTRQSDLILGEEAGTHDDAGNVVQPDTPLPGDMVRKQARPRRNAAPTAHPGPRETARGDTTTAHLLAYLAQHDHATQAEMAAALGVTVRTIQRKLARLRTQRSEAS